MNAAHPLHSLSAALFGAPRRRAFGKAAAGFCVLLALEGPARAEDASQAAAEQLFQEGRVLMDQGRFEAACEKFKESARLDVAPGTVLNLAQCYERVGRTASAWARYREVASLSTRRGQPERAAFAETKVKELAGQLVSIVYVVPRPEPGLVVEQDGVDLGRAAWGTSIPVDPGPHQFRARAPGFRTWSASVFVRRSNQRMEIPALRAALPPPGRLAPEGTHPARIAGVGLLVASGVAGAATFVLGGLAKMENDRARRDECGPTSCSPEGSRRIDRATTFANVATGVGIGTLVLLGTGLTLYLVGGSSASSSTGERFSPIVRF